MNKALFLAFLLNGYLGIYGAADSSSSSCDGSLQQASDISWVVDMLGAEVEGNCFVPVGAFDPRILAGNRDISALSIDNLAALNLAILKDNKVALPFVKALQVNLEEKEGEKVDIARVMVKIINTCPQLRALKLHLQEPVAVACLGRSIVSFKTCGSKTLYHLDLSNSAIETLPAAWLMKLPALKRLNLSRNRLRQIGARVLLTGGEGLSFLNLSHQSQLVEKDHYPMFVPGKGLVVGCKRVEHPTLANIDGILELLAKRQESVVIDMSGNLSDELAPQLRRLGSYKCDEVDGVFTFPAPVLGAVSAVMETSCGSIGGESGQ